METAKRELGHSEEAIKEHSFVACSRYPSLAMKQVELLPGKTERDLIDAIKKAFERVDELSQDEIALLNSGMQQPDVNDFSNN